MRTKVIGLLVAATVAFGVLAPAVSASTRCHQPRPEQVCFIHDNLFVDAGDTFRLSATSDRATALLVVTLIPAAHGPGLGGSQPVTIFSRYLIGAQSVSETLIAPTQYLKGYVAEARLYLCFAGGGVQQGSVNLLPS